MQLVLDTKGIVVKKRNNCFHLKTDKHERLISPQRVSSIAITSYCSLTTSAIRLAIQNGIPIYFINAIGKVEGRLWTGEFGNLSTLRRYQVLIAEKKEILAWIVRLFTLKTERQIENIEWILEKNMLNNSIMQETLTQLYRSKEQFQNITKPSLKEAYASILGIEGAAAKAYWGAISACLPLEWQFKERSRQPAQDPFNLLLNYLYGMLYGLIETAIFTAGLDPYFGIFHADQYNKPTLVFDMIEPFRPWVDAFLVEGIMKWEIKDTYFDKIEQGGFVLSKTGKAFFIPLFNNFMAERLMLSQRHFTRKAHIAKEIYDFVDFLKKTFENPQ